MLAGGTRARRWLVFALVGGRGRRCSSRCVPTSPMPASLKPREASSPTQTYCCIPILALFSVSVHSLPSPLLLLRRSFGCGEIESCRELSLFAHDCGVLLRRDWIVSSATRASLLQSINRQPSNPCFLRRCEEPITWLDRLVPSNPLWRSLPCFGEQTVVCRTPARRQRHQSRLVARSSCHSMLASSEP